MDDGSDATVSKSSSSSAAREETRLSRARSIIGYLRLQKLEVKVMLLSVYTNSTPKPVGIRASNRRDIRDDLNLDPM